MKFEITKLPEQQVKIIAEVERAKLESSRQKAAKQLSSRNKIPGFRPGKAPMDIVRRVVGEENIEQEAIEILIDEIYPQIIKESELNPSGAGKLEEIISKDPLKFSFIVPLQPLIDLGEYKKIRYKYIVPEVSDEEIEKVVSRLQLNASTTEDSQNVSETGDLVSVHVSAKLINPNIGENEDILKNSRSQHIIGNDEENFPFEGFSNELIGLKTGEEKEFKHKFKKNSPYQKLQGKEVLFHVTVENLKKINKPELNNEFAKTVGYDNLETLFQSIKDQLLETKTREYSNQYYSDLIDKIIAQSKIEYPPHLLDEEIESVQKSFEHNLTHQNLDFDTYLKINNLEKDKFIESEIKPAAKKRLEQSLVIEEVGRLENIELKKDELQKEYTQTVMEMQTGGDFQRLQRKVSPKKLSNALVMQAASKLMNKRVLDTLKNMANGAYQEKPELNTTKKPTKSKRQKKNDE